MFPANEGGVDGGVQEKLHFHGLIYQSKMQTAVEKEQVQRRVQKLTSEQCSCHAIS